MERFVDPCCEKCTHTKITPCKDFVECCLEGPICHKDQSCKEKRMELVNKVRLHENFVVY
ncbi:MAG: hypothetical protein GX973_05090 [Firmicutes bacterium]|nr:hypothetical protein [Bacillota bacterium]